MHYRPTNNRTLFPRGGTALLRGWVGFVLAAALLAAGLASCAGEGGGPGAGTVEVGSITAQVVWPDESLLTGLRSPGIYSTTLPAAVVTVRAIVTGPGMSEMQFDFDAGLGAGSADGIPVGSNRTLTLQGLDDGELVLYQGQVTGITVTAGVVSDVGTVETIRVNTNGITVDPVSGLVTSEAGTSAEFTVALDTAPAADVTVTFTSGDVTEVMIQGGDSPDSPVQTLTLTFTPDDWDTAQTVTAVGQDDAILDGNQTVTVTAAPAVSADPAYDGLDPADVQVTNGDDDGAGISVLPVSGLVTNEAGGTAGFTVSLNSQPMGAVQVAVTTGDATEVLLTGGNSPFTPAASIELVFTPADWADPQTVTAIGQDDGIIDGNQTVTVTTAPATSGDGDYAGLDPPDVQVTNNDDDTAGITVTPTSGLATSEAGGTATFTVVLNTPPADNVDIQVTSGDATEALVKGGSSPLTPMAAITLTFRPSDWSDSQTVTVLGQDDSLADGAQLLTISLAAATSTDPDYNGLDGADVAVTNSDDDVSGVGVNPTSGLIVNEGGATDSFTVVLGSEPTADVTVAVSSPDTTEALVKGGDSPSVAVGAITLTFTSSDWSTPQTVTVVGQNDDIVDGPQAFNITLADAVSGDGDYDGLSVADVGVTNNDNDVEGITVTPTSGLVTGEGGTNDTFSVTLNTMPGADVTVGVSSSDTTEALVQGGDSPFTPVAAITLTFTSSDWSTPQTVTVAGQNDDIDDGNQNITIVTAAAASGDTGYNGINPADVGVTNNDNDAAGISVNPTTGLATTEGGGNDTFTVVLDTQPMADVTIGVSSNDTSEALVKGGDSPVTPVAAITLTFTSGDWSTPQTVTVIGQDDDIDDGNQGFSIVTAAAASSDTNYSGLNADDAAGTNNDDDVAGISVTPTTGLTTTEAGGTDTFTIVLNTEPTADVTLDVSTGDSTEALVMGGDSPVTPVAAITLTFTSADWSTPQTVTVVGQDDALDDGDQGITIATAAAVSLDGNYDTVNPDNVAVTNNDNDVAGISVSPTSGLVTTEAGGTDTFTVVLNTEPTADVTVDVGSGDTTEALVKGGDSPSVAVDAITLTFTSSDWSTPQTVTVVGQDDSLDDGDIGVTLTTAAAASTDGDYDGLNPADVTATNNDDDAAGISVTPTSGLTTTEAGGIDTFTVVLNSEPTDDVTIDVGTGDITEVLVKGGDSPSVAVDVITLTFTSSDWSSSQTVTLVGQDDSLDDGDPTVTITTAAAVSSDSDYSGLNAANVNVTNSDDDVAGISVTPTSGLVTTEGGGTDTFTIVLNTEPTDDVTVDASTGDNTEILLKGGDSPSVAVDAITLTFTSSDWSTPQTVTLVGQDDDLDDGDPTVTITTAAAVSTDGNYDGLNPANVTATNTDDDFAGISVTPTSGLTTSEAGGTDTFTVVLNSEPTDDVTVDVSSGDDTEILLKGGDSPSVAVNAITLTFTSSDWSTPQTVTLVGQDDSLDDGDPTVTITTAAAASTDGDYDGLNPADVTATNSDDDVAGISVTPTSGLTTTEAGGTDSFDVVLNTLPGFDVTVDVSTGDTTEVLLKGGDSPSVAVDVIRLTFTSSDWSTPQTVTLVGQDDSLDDGDPTVTITTDPAVSTDSDYDGLNPANVTATNTDDDAAGISVTPSSGLTTTEAGGTDTFAVVLNTEPTTDVTIDLTSNLPGEVLMKGGDSPSVAVDTITLTFTSSDWSTPQTVTLVGQDDAFDDGDIGVTILTAAAVSGDSGYSGLNAADVSVTNTDDDAAGISVTPTSGLVTTEAGGTDTFDVVLNTPPSDDVTLDISTGDDTEVLVQGGDSPSVAVTAITLTFTSSDWSTPQTVTLVGQDDALDDGNIGVTIATAAASSTDSAYGGLDPADVSVTNNDDDAAGISVTPVTGLITTEAGGTDTFTVVLDTQPSGDVTLDVSTPDTSEVLVQGGDSPATPVTSITLTFTNSDWSTPQTVTLVGQDDSLLDGNVDVTIDVGAASGGGYTGIDPADVDVRNDDDEPPGDVPTIGTIADKSTPQDTMIEFIQFTADEGSDPGQDGEVLSVVSITSDNQTVVPDGNISYTFTDNGDGGDGEIAITPAAGQTGSATITVTVTDGVSSVDAVATFTLTVNVSIDPPVAYPVNAATAQNTAVAVTLAATPASGESIASWSIESSPAHGSLTGTPPNLTYTPDPGYSGRDSFVYYAIDDDEGESSNLAIATMIVNGSAIFFVNNPSSLPAGDATVKATILALGFNVTMVDDNDVANGNFDLAAEIPLVDLLIFSSSVGSANITGAPSGGLATIRNSTTPILTWERYLYDDFQMTAGENSPNAGTTNGTQINIVNEAHPLAGGLLTADNPITVFTSSQPMVWAAVSSDGDVVAETTGGNPVLFSYEPGDTMQGGLVAPAKRVGYFLPDAGAGNLTADAITLLEAAINEALAR